MDWNDLRIAVAVARAGSLSRAGRMLGLDQTTVGRRLTALEAAVGSTLFVRTRAGVALTEAGQEVIDLAHEMEARVNRLPEVLAQSNHGVSGEVRIEGVAWVLTRLIEAAVPSLGARYPGLSLNMVGAAASPDQWSATPTVGLWFEQRPNSGAFAIKLGSIPHKTYAHRSGDPSQLPWATLCGPHGDRGRVASQGAIAMDAVNPAAPPHAAPLPATMRVNCTNALVCAVRTGRYKAILPACLGGVDPTFVALDQDGDPPSPPLYIHAHPDTIGSSRVQAVIGWLRDAFEATFAPGTPSASPKCAGK